MLVEIHKLKLNLGAHAILRDVNLTLEKGQIYGLLGPNGAGKSTTISVVTGLRAPSSGSVRVLGLDPVADALQLHRRIGVLAEQAGFYDWMSAGEYLRWVASLYQMTPDNAEIARLLGQVGLEGESPAPIETYSRGMRQRLGLARALINQPELLILDEPTNGLDPRGRREIHDVLLDLSANHGVGILLCTHLLDDVDRLCIRIGIIAEGQTLLEGSIADLLSSQRAAVRYRLRMEPGESAERLPADITLLARAGDWWHVEIASHIEPAGAWRKLLDAGLRIDEIHREGGGLEELYMAVTEAKEAA
ncbi:MAG: ABC transporter ATP-binding protein [Gammaproteobacteria bacterium]|nr:ABC transporter ATP-binding protein [Gammaproteobacteria bacterium]